MRHVAAAARDLVTNPSDAINALNQLYADAACLGTSVSP